MVIVRNNVSKESTYGWYPSQVNVYENPRAKHGYDKECLFRFWNSKLHHSNPQGVTPPGSRALGSARGSRVRSATPSQKQSRPAVVRPRTASISGHYGEKVPDVSKLMIEGSRPASLNEEVPPSQFIFERSRPNSQAKNIPTPKLGKGYHGWQPQPTIIGVVDPTGPFIPSRDEDNTETACERPAAPSPVVIPSPFLHRPQTPAQMLSGRVQSAAAYRPKPSPTRSVKSASTRSKVKSITPSTDIKIEPTPEPREIPERKLASRTYWAQLKHELQAPEEPVSTPTLEERPPTPVQERSPTPPYEEQLDKYGWLVEVHGDPLNIKRIPERMPYTVKCAEPTVKPSPYKVKVTVGDTFFLNTIPRKPMTFTVHPEWQSENFVAKRKELEKQGLSFHTRSYGFVY